MNELHDIEDRIVAIHLAKMEGNLEFLKNSNNEISKQLELVIQEIKEMHKISQKLSIYDESIKKIWEKLDTKDNLQDIYLKSMSTEISSVKDRVNKIFWFSAGFSSIGSVLIALITWLVLIEVDHGKSLEERLRNVELYIAGDRKDVH
ncbi:MAG: hypothetical protein DDT31_00514 [Syntrophomonadaceae bacterium]|nr:hypothetical protein [Bacillota bacterium]